MYNWNEIYREYKRGKSIYTLSKMFNIRPQNIWRGFKNNKLQTRTKREAMLVKKAKRFKLNHFGHAILRINGNKIYRSHYTWIKENQMPIPKGFVIHHADLNPLNDKIENLILLPDSVHKSLHIHLQLQGFYSKHMIDAQLNNS